MTFISWNHSLFLRYSHSFIFFTFGVLPKYLESVHSSLSMESHYAGEWISYLWSIVSMKQSAVFKYHSETISWHAASFPGSLAFCNFSDKPGPQFILYLPLNQVSHWPNYDSAIFYFLKSPDFCRILAYIFPNFLFFCKC
jgi:hypothetical protein